VAVHQCEGGLALAGGDGNVGARDRQVRAHVDLGRRGHGQQFTLAPHLRVFVRMQGRLLGREPVRARRLRRRQDLALEPARGVGMSGVAFARPDRQRRRGVVVAALLVGRQAGLAETQIGDLGQVVVRPAGVEPQLRRRRDLQCQPVLVLGGGMVALPEVGGAEVQARAGDELGLDRKAVCHLEHAPRILDRTRIVADLAVHQTQVAAGLEHRLAVGRALVKVERPVLVLQRARQVGRAPPVLAPGLLQHRQRRHRQRVVARPQALGTVQRGLGSRVVAQHEQPRQTHQRDHIFLHQRLRRSVGLRLAHAGAPQAVRTVLVVGKGAVGVTGLVVLAERAVNAAEHQGIVVRRRQLQGLLVGREFTLGVATHAPQPAQRHQQFAARARRQRRGQSLLDERIGLGRVRQLAKVAIEQGDESVDVARAQLVPQGRRRIARGQRQAGLAAMPGRACGSVGQTQPLEDETLYVLAQ